MEILGNAEEVPLADLRAHPENATIFGAPEEDDSFASLKQSIRDNGQWEPILAKADGTVLSGHSRLRVLKALKRPTALVRRVLVDSYREELEILIRSNTDRRQMSPRQNAFAFKRLKETAKEDGGAKKKVGRPENGGEKTTVSKTRDDAAAMLGVNTNEARALETVFTTEGVPERKCLRLCTRSGHNRLPWFRKNAPHGSPSAPHRRSWRCCTSLRRPRGSPRPITSGCSSAKGGRRSTVRRSRSPENKCPRGVRAPEDMANPA